ncbi:amino acid kinase family protein [Salinibacter sp.]|uniref:amino acid kinase family protein n=1 Tax=Salinibacter sp. TaxID=2065818 RepID=UPI002FC3534E
MTPFLDPDHMQSLYLLYLDRHHLGDELFLKSLAQHFSNAGPEAPPCVLVHGSGEKVERTLEAQGYFPERTDGVLDVETEDQRRLVERAVREVNQEIVAALTDEVVSTVGIQGVDRGLFQGGGDAPLRAENVGWLSALLKQHVLPVVSALVETPDADVREVGTEEALGALAEALGDSFEPVACVLTTADAAGLPDEGEGVRAEVDIGGVDEEPVPEPAAVRRLAAADVPVLITNLQGLLRGASPTGTRVRS